MKQFRGFKGSTQRGPRGAKEGRKSGHRCFGGRGGGGGKGQKESVDTTTTTDGRKYKRVGALRCHTSVNQSRGKTHLLQGAYQNREGEGLTWRTIRSFNRTLLLVERRNPSRPCVRTASGMDWVASTALLSVFQRS